jgi:MFS family permease
MITYVAIPYQMYAITQSSSMVGVVGMVQLITLVIFGMIGGSLADDFSKKRIMIFAAAIGAIGNLGLIFYTLSTHQSPMMLLVLAAVMSFAKALERPALESLTQKIIPKDELSLVSPLSTLKSNAGFIIGPAVGGLLISMVGIFYTYIVDLLTFLISIYCVSKIKHVEQIVVKKNRRKIKEQGLNIWEGMKYAAQRPVVLGSYLIDILAMTLAFPHTLFPEMSYSANSQHLLGWFYSAPAIGGLLAVLLSGWTYATKYHGRWITISAAMWCVGILGFAFSYGTPMGFVWLAVAGLFDAYSGIFRGTLWNESIESAFRGRLAGVEMISYSAGPLLGGFLMGFMSDIIGKTQALMGGSFAGIVVVIWAGFKIKKFWNYQSNANQR